MQMKVLSWVTPCGGKDSAECRTFCLRKIFITALFLSPADWEKLGEWKTIKKLSLQQKIQ